MISLKKGNRSGTLAQILVFGEKFLLTFLQWSVFIKLSRERGLNRCFPQKIITGSIFFMFVIYKGLIKKMNSFIYLEKFYQRTSGECKLRKFLLLFEPLLTL